MTRITLTIRTMTFQEASQLRLHNRGLVLEHQGRSYHLSAGTSDRIQIFQQSVCLYVLTSNNALGYLGLDAYMPDEPDPVNTVFLHYENDIAEILGKGWEEMEPEDIVTRLQDYLI